MTAIERVNRWLFCSTLNCFIDPLVDPNQSESPKVHLLFAPSQQEVINLLFPIICCRDCHWQRVAKIRGEGGGVVVPRSGIFISELHNQRDLPCYAISVSYLNSILWLALVMPWKRQLKRNIRLIENEKLNIVLQWPRNLQKNPFSFSCSLLHFQFQLQSINANHFQNTPSHTININKFMALKETLTRSVEEDKKYKPVAFY